MDGTDESAAAKTDHATKCIPASLPLVSRSFPSALKAPLRPPKRSGLGIEIPDIARVQTHTISDDATKTKRVALDADSSTPISADAHVNSVKVSANIVETFESGCIGAGNLAMRPVRVLMPTICDCGAPIVGCWYRKKAHWCEWFRHSRYEPLVSQFVLQRSKCGRQSRSQQPFTPPPLPAAPASTSSESDDSYHCPLWSAESMKESKEVWLFDALGPPCSPSEVLGPAPLSVLCLTQFLKHKDAVQTAYCGHPIISSCPVEQLKTHVDCRNAKSYVHFRWYSNSIIQELKQHELSQSPSTIGCINIQHWNKKMPKARDSLPRSSKELVELGLEIDKVVSTFQVVAPDQDSVQVETLRRPDRSRIKSWREVDEMVWTTTANLGILPPELIKQQRGVPFPPELARSDQSWTSCGCKSDRSPVPIEAVKSVNISQGRKCDRVSSLPEFMRPAHEAMLDWISRGSEECEYHLKRLSEFESRPASSVSNLWGIESGSFFRLTHEFKCYHFIISDSSALELDVESFIRSSSTIPCKGCEAVGLFFSIRVHSGDQTVVVTNCINSIQSALQNIFSKFYSEMHRLPPRVFVALCIQGEFHVVNCEARCAHS